MSARKKNCSKSSQTASKKNISNTKRQFFELSSTLTKIKPRITAFCGKPQETSSSEDNCGKESPVSGDAGNSFGIRASKHNKAGFPTPLCLALFGLMIFINFYLLTRLGGNKPAREGIIKTSQIKHVVSSVLRKMGPTRYLL